MTNRRFSAAVAAVSLALTGFVATTTVHAAGPQVGVILPDSASSPRWETDDRPLLAAAFKAAGVTYDIQNALGDKTKFATIAQAMLTEGKRFSFSLTSILHQQLLLKLLQRSKALQQSTTTA